MKEKQYYKDLDLSLEQNSKNYSDKKFSIIRRLGCTKCGFFSFYIVHLGCIHKCLLSGLIPVIDLKSFPNVYNKGNTSINNPFELFFNQPFNYTLDDVKKYAKNIEYFDCNEGNFRPDERKIYYNKYLIMFWHNFAERYMSFKKEIIHKTENIIKQLFGNSKNILGVKIRGTDYIALKIKNHPIPPKIETLISDVKRWDIIYKYDFIFFSTEDELLKSKFVPEFGNKLKLLNPKEKLQYNYNNQKEYVTMNDKIYGNLDYMMNYVYNIIILSKCLDIIAARCSGTAGIFILGKGFRHKKIYNLGDYS